MFSAATGYHNASLAAKRTTSAPESTAEDLPQSPFTTNYQQFEVTE